MKITDEQAYAIALALEEQAKRNWEVVGPASLHAEVMEQVARALRRGEAVQREKRR